MKTPAFLDRKYFPELDGLRAVAAWTVVAYHMGVQGIPGSYGVVLFFVLSGFLITLLLLREYDKYGTIDLKGFYIRRTLRIMPAFYVYVIFATVFILVRHNPLNVGHLVAAATYTLNYYNAYLGDPNTAFSHAWSLAIEEQFYLLWPFTLRAFIKRDKLANGLLACIGLVWVVRTALRLYTQIPQSYFYASLEMRADALLVGVLLAVVLVRSPERITALLNRISPTVVFYGGLLAIVILARFEFEFGSKFRDTVTAALLPVFCATLMLGALAREPLLKRSWLSSRIMVWLGRISYSTYLYQQMAADWGEKVLPSHPVLAIGVSTLCILALASGSYYVIERPALEWKERITRNRAERLQLRADVAAATSAT